MKKRALAVLLGLLLGAGIQYSRAASDQRSPSTPVQAPSSGHATTAATVKNILVVPLSFAGHDADLETIKARYGERLPRYIRAVSQERLELNVTITPWISMPHPISEYRLGSFRIRGMPYHWLSQYRLGWIDELKIATVGAGEVRRLRVSPLVNGEGKTLVVRLPLDERRYYLIENRQQEGIDHHLPSEGILIMRVDETIAEGRGPVRVVDAHPEVQYFGAAPFKSGETFRDTEHGITVMVLGKEGDEYSLCIRRENISSAGGVEDQRFFGCGGR